MYMTYSQIDLLDEPVALPRANVHLWTHETLHGVEECAPWRDRDLGIDARNDRTCDSVSAMGLLLYYLINDEPWLV